MTKLLYVMCGLPASGKSTFCELYKSIAKGKVRIHSSDAIREELTGDVNNQSCNNRVFALMNSRTIQDLNNGYEVLYDATNLTARERRNLLAEVKDAVGGDLTAVCVFFDVSAEECKRRNSGRERVVPPEVIERKSKYLQKPTKQEGWNKIAVFTEKD